MGSDDREGLRSRSGLVEVSETGGSSEVGCGGRPVGNATLVLCESSVIILAGSKQERKQDDSEMQPKRHADILLLLWQRL